MRAKNKVEDLAKEIFIRIVSSGEEKSLAFDIGKNGAKHSNAVMVAVEGAIVCAQGFYYLGDKSDWGEDGTLDFE